MGHIDHLTEAIARLDTRIEEASLPFARQTELLATIPGIGKRAAQLKPAQEEVGEDVKHRVLIATTSAAALGEVLLGLGEPAVKARSAGGECIAGRGLRSSQSGRQRRGGRGTGRAASRP